MKEVRAWKGILKSHTWHSSLACDRAFQCTHTIEKPKYLDSETIIDAHSAKITSLKEPGFSKRML
jgi:hypothetical protein